MFDPRAELLADARPERLFIPDAHYAEAGNEIILKALRRHLSREDAEGGEG